MRPWRQLDEAAFAFRHRLADLSGQLLHRPDISRAFRGADLKLPRAKLKRRMHVGVHERARPAGALPLDHETNFLLQIRGEKSVRLYPKGRATLCEEEIEDCYRFNALASA